MKDENNEYELKKKKPNLMYYYIYSTNIAIFCKSFKTTE